jgi:hypothetical protein
MNPLFTLLCFFCDVYKLCNFIPIENNLLDRVDITIFRIPDQKIAILMEDCMLRQVVIPSKENSTFSFYTQKICITAWLLKILLQ